MNENPHYLQFEEFGLTVKQAQKLVIEILAENKISVLNSGWDKTITDLQNNHKELVPFLGGIVNEVRKRGFFNFLQAGIDFEDAVFGRSMGISAPDYNAKPFIVSFGDYSKEFPLPMSANPPEWDISNDILYYRNQSCLSSNNYNFQSCTRYYRAYLFSCISLVDAFINKHIFYYEFQKSQNPDLSTLKTTGRLEDRLSLLLKISTTKSLADISGGVQWIHFKKLRKLRNDITHINEPMLGYSIADFAVHFNLVREGIGGLLGLIRNLQGKPPLSFIQCLKAAPIAYFNEITEVEGKKIIKRRK